MKIAFLGLGNMGAPMARNLVKAGHRVTVWNRTRERAREVSGAAVANTPAEAAKNAEAAVTMLADDQAAETVVFGENGLLQGLHKGAIHISSSTISVEFRGGCGRRMKSEVSVTWQRRFSGVRRRQKRRSCLSLPPGRPT